MPSAIVVRNRGVRSGLLGALVAVLAPAAAHGQPPAALVAGLKSPEAVVAGTDGKVYVAAGGAVLVVRDGKATPFAAGMDEPRSLAAYLEWLFVADRDRVWRVNRAGKAEVFVPAARFPAPPHGLRAVTVDPESGTLYVADSGDGKDQTATIYRVGPKDRKVTSVTDGRRFPALRAPTALRLDGASHLLVADADGGTLHRIRLADGTAELLAEGLGGCGGIAWDYYGRLFLSDRKGGRLLVIARPGDRPVPLPQRFEAPAGLSLDPTGKSLLVPDATAGTLTAVRAAVPGAEVDETPLPLETAVAFPNLKWAGWSSEDPSGKIVPLRPLVLTHAGDGSNRVFIATQHGVIHVLPNDQKAARSKVFLDLRDRVKYNDNTNEEGFLGLVFHPRYKETGEFFVFYTPKKEKLTNLVVRFRVSRDDPDRADPTSEEELLRFRKPFWNHDGGTILFGPDGYLYVTHGDGGAANDPFGNGQNLKALLGKVLRIDVDRKDAGKNYAIPKDNPFVNRSDALPEIWAYGLRNVWRMAFDRRTGRLWAADVGQNLYEEIDFITKGGNYGWNLREGLHPFGAKGVGPRKDLIEPIWEYHHDVGKSITGGPVYRGRRLPELDGAYLYADYVSGKIWALRYDDAKGRVVANQPIRDRALPIMSFGEDAEGDVYLMTYAASGQGVYRFVRTEKARPTP
jgi:glucose/arabinose dehydrogenase